jgi:hypothetical protein
LPETRTADGLKAAEMLVKMCGWKEPEKVSVQNVEVKADTALIEQLRAGYAQLSERSAKAPRIPDWQSSYHLRTNRALERTTRDRDLIGRADRKRVKKPRSEDQ